MSGIRRVAWVVASPQREKGTGWESIPIALASGCRAEGSVIERSTKTAANHQALERADVTRRLGSRFQLNTCVE
jgi:hypothetical protein